MKKTAFLLIAVLFVMVGCQAAPALTPVPTLPPSAAPAPTVPPLTPTAIPPTQTVIPPSPTPRPTADLVLSEEFSDQSGWWCQKETGTSVDWYCQDGELHAVSRDQNRFGWKGRANSYRDFIMQVQVRFIGDAGEAALIFRAFGTPPSMYVSFVFPSGQGSLMKYIEGKRTVLSEPTGLPAIKKGGATNTLKIVAQGSRFTFYANEVELVRTADASFADGQVGVGAADGAHVVFDNLKIWVPVTPAP